MKRKIIGLAVAAAIATTTSACMSINVYASDTTQGIRFNYSFNEPTSRTLVRTDKAVDPFGNTLVAEEYVTSGEPDHSTIKLWTNTNWENVQSRLTVDLENFENNHVDATEYVVTAKRGEGEDEQRKSVRKSYADKSADYTRISANWTLRGDIGGLTGVDLGYGPLDKIYWAGKVNWVAGYGERQRFWTGPTFVFNVPLTTGVELSTWYRNTVSNEAADATWHHILSYNTVPLFNLAGGPVNFGQTYELIGGGERADGHVWLETESAINWKVNRDIGLSLIYGAHADIDGNDSYDFQQVQLSYNF